jgi:peptide/nickel transport system substrate-binding protein
MKLRIGKSMSLFAATMFGLTLAVFPWWSTDAHAKGGELTVAVPSVDGEDFDPVRFLAAGQHNYYPLVFDPFIAKDPQSGKLVPGLATEWKVSDDGKSWIIKLRQGVKFHDGSAFSAKDAKFSLERYIGKFGKVAASGSDRLAGLITSIDIIDDYTIAIRSKNGAPTIPFDLTTDPGSASCYVVPKDYVEKVGADGFNKAPVGTGPFIFVSQEIGRRMMFKANAQYWGQVPDVDTLTLRIVPELAARIGQLRSGEADIISGVVGPAVPQVKSDSKLRLLRAEKGQLIYAAIGGITNPQSPLSKKEVREAISLAIDRKGIVDHLLYGNGAPASLMGFPFSFGWPKDADSYGSPYDPAKAKALLASAGYPNGFTLTLYAATAGRDFAQAIAQYLNAVNIKVDLQVREIQQVLSELRSDTGKTQTRLALIFGPTGSGARADFGGLLYTYFAPGESAAQPNNDKEVADLVVKQASESNPDRRAQMIGDALKKVHQEKLIFMLYYADSVFAVGPAVADWTPIPGVGYPSNLQSVKKK